MILTTDNDLQMRRWALLSEDGLYRYVLGRAWSGGPLVVFIMLNPSTADAAQDDRTIRRCMRFAQEWQCGGIVVVNMFAFRTTKPVVLRQAADPVGPENDQAILKTCFEAERIIAAWGNGSIHGRDRYVSQVLLKNHDLMCLRKTKKGHPEHPLYIPKKQRPIIYRKAA